MCLLLCLLMSELDGLLAINFYSKLKSCPGNNLTLELTVNIIQDGVLCAGNDAVDGIRAKVKAYSVLHEPDEVLRFIATIVQLMNQNLDTYS